SYRSGVRSLDEVYSFEYPDLRAHRVSVGGANAADIPAPAVPVLQVVGTFPAKLLHSSGPCAPLCSNTSAGRQSEEGSWLHYSDNRHCAHHWCDHDKHTHIWHRQASPAISSETLSLGY